MQFVLGVVRRHVGDLVEAQSWAVDRDQMPNELPSVHNMVLELVQKPELPKSVQTKSLSLACVCIHKFDMEHEFSSKPPISVRHIVYHDGDLRGKRTFKLSIALNIGCICKTTHNTLSIVRSQAN